MTVLLHVSDPHFGAEVPHVVEALEGLARELRPDLLVLSGDVTQRARRAEFAAAREFLARLSVPQVLTIPGNHDIPLFNVAARAAAPYAGFQRVFGPELEPSFHAADCLVLGVKTTRRYRHVDGEISDEQRERVAARLREASSAQLRIVVLHQPVAVPRETEQKNVVHGHAAAVQSWAEAGADVLLAGHIHLPFMLPLHESRPLPRPLWAINAGTAVSSRVRYDAGNSVNVLRTAEPPSAGRATVEHWTYREPQRAFLRSARLELGESG
ncbi:MAG: putative repair exonuclease [Polyangiaceae bacterium]|nr:putative repair exonuclease [Polyangiaceae bacterium]